AGARPLTPHAGSSVVHFQVCVLRSAILNSKLVRLPGVALGHALWRRAILLLNHNRRNSKGEERPALLAHAISTKNKHLLLSCDTNPRSHAGSFGVWGHTFFEALNL